MAHILNIKRPARPIPSRFGKIFRDIPTQGHSAGFRHTTPSGPLPGEQLLEHIMFDGAPDALPLADMPAEEPSPRALGPAVLRGWRRRCPDCGAGPMMKGYLTVRDSCPVCGTDLHHHRADDGPAYLTILIVGHLLAPALFWAFVTFRPDPMILASVFTVLCTGLSLYLLPRLKGLIVGFQWAKRMHGFRTP